MSPAASPPAHDRLIQRYSLHGTLVGDSAVHVGTGAGAAGAEASDMPVARDGRGRPYIPGASLRGALRAGLESLLRGLGRPALRVCDPFEDEGPDRSCSQRVNLARKDRRTLTEAESFDLAWQHSCAVCQLFGHSFLASRVRLADLPLQACAGEDHTYTRDGVGLDRDLRTAARGILYNFEAVPAAARFDLRIECENAEPHEMGLLLVGLDLFGDGLATVGGKSARGLGRARIEDLSIVRRRPADFFAGTGGMALGPDELAGFRDAAQRHYLGGAD